MSELQPRFSGLFWKVLVVGVLTVAMLWPLALVQSLVAERHGLQGEAQQRIAAANGGAQRIGAPILMVPIERPILEENKTHEKKLRWVDAEPLRLLADSATMNTDITVTLRHKGIYTLPTYAAPLHLQGVFSSDTLQNWRRSEAGERARWDRAVLLLPVMELKSLHGIDKVQIAGLAPKAETGRYAGQEGVRFAVDLTSALSGESVAFALDLQLGGSSALSFVPLAGNTEIAVQSQWPHPDFNGAFLPISSRVDAGGFRAKWRVIELNRAVPQQWRGDEVSAEALNAASFGVTLYQPVDLYAQNYRAVRYGLLFIAITFLCFFAWEHGSKDVRLHPMQYLLVGLALSVFYLLLIALSEHLGFAWAYLTAASALVLLVTVYLFGATGKRLASMIVGAGIASSYALLYMILLSEDYALLFGALLVFTVLAILMLATRKLDWSAVARRSV